jgi:hypothetical protein
VRGTKEKDPGLSTAILISKCSNMDIAKIKNLVKQNGDKFIFLEDGEPELVVMSFKAYEKLLRSEPAGEHPLQSPYSQADFADLGTRGFEETELVTPILAESIGLPVRLEDIRLEDLPI